MADNVKPTFAKADVKSGNTSDSYGEKVLGGVPDKKSVDEIEKVNTVHTAPNAAGV